MAREDMATQARCRVRCPQRNLKTLMHCCCATSYALRRVQMLPPTRRPLRKSTGDREPHNAIPSNRCFSFAIAQTSVRAMAFNIDLHTHSHFSGDGVSSPEDLITAGRAKGLHGVAITDHNTCGAIPYLLEKGLMRSDG